MNRRFLKLLSLILTLSVILGTCPFALGTVGTAARSTEQNEEAAYVPGEVLFNLTSSAGSARLHSLEDSLGLEILEAIDRSALNSGTSTSSAEGETTLYRAGFDASKAGVYELCKALNALPDITDAEPNYTYAPESFNMPTEISASSQYSTMQKWYFNNMKLTEAWQEYENLGEGVVVCVIDNGLNFNHNEIKNRLWDDGNGNHGYNAELNNNDIYGLLEGGPAHGSHCAGIIAMEGSNGGLVGVAPKAKIMACNAVSSASGTFTNANLIKSLEYAVKHGADVISMSLGGYSYSVNMEKALQRASLSAVILCAAGNDGLNAATRLHYPSASSAVIGVMALGSGSSANTLSDYSNYDLTGRYYQVAAPGTDIYAIAAQSNTGYVRMTGTSMATPFMAGLSALYIAEHPELSPTEARHAIIEASGEMVKGYGSTVSTKAFKKATPLTFLGETPAPAQNITISDKTILAAVRDALGTDEALTNYDLECITTLDLRNTSFKNYAALAPLTKLTSLNLSGTGMTDADAAALAPHLANTLLNFDISSNQLTNLDLFENYSGYISRLVASQNALADISGISGFTMLSDLDVSFNKLKDISPASTLSGMVYFYAPGNEIENPAPIIDLSMLEEVYFGNYNPNFTDMFGELYFLSGSAGNHIYSLEAFLNINQYSSNIHYLNLSNNYVNKDSQLNYRAAKLMQILDYIGSHRDFESIFDEPVTYKLVLSPFATGKLIFANDIAFENERNFATLYLNGEGYTIPYTVLPENANAKTNVTFAIKDESIAYVNESGVIYPKKAGSTYLSLTLESGRVRTFFITVKDSYVIGADILNPCSVYTAGESYTAVIYTSPSEEIKLSDQNGNTLESFSDNGKYCFNLTDANGNAFQKWLVPFSVASAGEYTISVSAKSKNSEQFTANIASFECSVQEAFGNTLSGTVEGYASRFDTLITLLGADNTALQTLHLQGGVNGNGDYRFTGVANGVYSLLIERDGYLPYRIENITVNGDTVINRQSGTSFAEYAGDVNTDKSIDIADVSSVLAQTNYTQSFSTAENVLCDLNGDDLIDISDLALVLANQAR